MTRKDFIVLAEVLQIALGGREVGEEERGEINYKLWKINPAFIGEKFWKAVAGEDK